MAAAGSGHIQRKIYFYFCRIGTTAVVPILLFHARAVKANNKRGFTAPAGFGPSGENAFGADRVCAAMKAPVGLLSGERSASADGGALPRQVPQAATNAK